MTHREKVPETPESSDGASSSHVGGRGDQPPVEPHDPRPPAAADGDAARSDDRPAEPVTPKPAPKKKKKGPAKLKPNNVRKLRIERMLSKAELARRANLSVLTIDRVEKGFGCRMNTKRKILEALGLSLADRVRVFGEEE